MMFERLLVPLDGSEAARAALDYVEQIPSRAVRLLTVIPDAEAPAREEQPDRWREWRSDAVARAEAYLAEVVPALARQGREVEPRVEIGDPAERIVHHATDADLIVMTTHGYGAGRRVIYGSVADRVVRYAPVPVLVVRGGERPVERSPIGRIVVPLDGSPLAEQALPVASALADDLGVPVHLVRALDAEMLRETVRAEASAAAAYAESIEAVRKVVATYLDDRAKELRGRDIFVTTEVRDGAPVDELLEMTKPGDVIVMTTRGRSGVRRWLLGSVAERLVRDAAVPVLLVRLAQRAE